MGDLANKHQTRLLYIIMFAAAAAFALLSACISTTSKQINIEDIDALPPEEGTCSLDPTCQYMKCENKNLHGTIYELFHPRTPSEFSMKGGKCSFEPVNFSTRKQIDTFFAELTNVRTTTKTNPDGKKEITSITLNQRDFAFEFMLGAGPSFSSYENANKYCNGRMNLAVTWLVAKTGQTYPDPPPNQLTGCYPEHSVIPLFILKKEDGKLAQKDIDKTVEIAKALANTNANQVGPVMITTETDFNSEDPAQVDFVKKQINAVKDNCLNCLVVFAPKYRDYKAIEDILGPPDAKTPIGENRDGNVLLGQGIFANNLDQGLLKSASSSEIARQLIAPLKSRESVSKYVLANYGMPTIITYLGAKPGIVKYLEPGKYAKFLIEQEKRKADGKTPNQLEQAEADYRANDANALGQEWTDVDVQKFYEEMYTKIPFLMQSGVVGFAIAQYDDADFSQLGLTDENIICNAPTGETCDFGVTNGASAAPAVGTGTTPAGPTGSAATAAGVATPPSAPATSPASGATPTGTGSASTTPTGTTQPLTNKKSIHDGWSYFCSSARDPQASISPIIMPVDKPSLICYGAANYNLLLGKAAEAAGTTSGSTGSTAGTGTTGTGGTAGASGTGSATATGAGATGSTTPADNAPTITYQIGGVRDEVGPAVPVIAFSCGSGNCLPLPPQDFVANLPPEINPKPDAGTNADYCTKFDPIIEKWAETRKLDPLLVRAVIMQENTGFVANEISGDGGYGLMQLTGKTPSGAPSDCQELDIYKNAPNKDDMNILLDPDFNVCWGTDILAVNIHKFEGDSRLDELATGTDATYKQWTAVFLGLKRYNRGDYADTSIDIYLNSPSERYGKTYVEWSKEGESGYKTSNPIGWKYPWEVIGNYNGLRLNTACAAKCRFDLTTRGLPVDPKDYPGVSITSRYGWRIHPISGIRKFHTGIDIDTSNFEPRTPVRAVVDGTIEKIKDEGAYGYHIFLQGADGYQYLYGHLKRESAMYAKGAPVSAGAIIAIADSTGSSTGDHLHFEVRNGDGSALDTAMATRIYDSYILKYRDYNGYESPDTESD